jgi:anti-sigma regulatory factor (Ser/Thr protein kinase)
LSEQAIDEEANAAVILATHEAVANALEHGSGTVVVRARLDVGAVVVEVHDQGVWRPSVGGDEARGRGLVLIQGVMHSVNIESDPEGTGVLMRRLLGEPSVLAGGQSEGGEAA